VLKEANNLCLRLWKDESGVVLAITVVVFLTLFLMACSVYAVGETIRQRVEVQNACDAAAYSAAVVQADSMSRIGAINRAMVWTYAQLVKRDMDLIVDAWLTRAYIEWLIDKIVAQLINSLGMCGKGHPYWLVGAPFHWESMRLNRHISVDADEVLQAVMGFLGQKIINLVMIESYKSNIQAMNAAIDDIIARMPDRIEHTVEEILGQHSGHVERHPFPRGPGRYHVRADPGGRSGRNILQGGEGRARVLHHRRHSRL